MDSKNILKKSLKSNTAALWLSKSVSNSSVLFVLSVDIFLRAPHELRGFSFSYPNP